jgi:eukaryotic-like serine/threonine-protein kinase
LPASGLTIEKFVLTSWTGRAIDRAGEEIYHNTIIPEKKSWATMESALKEIGQIMGSEFSKDFFLQYFDFGAEKVRLRFTGLPSTASAAVLTEINATLSVLNAGPLREDGGDVVIDADLSGGSSESVVQRVQESLVGSLNRKLGKTCFSVADGAATEVHVLFDADCTAAATLKRLDSLPPEALMEAPAPRIEDIVRDPGQLRRETI